MRRIVLALTVLLAAAGCGGAATTQGQASQGITVTSPAFSAGAPIPTRYTCRGAGVSPPLRWSGVPDGAAGVAVVVTDPDAPGGTFTHWVVFDLPADLSGFDAGTSPPQARQATNSAGGVGYTPPCPPGGTHHYRFTVHALDRPVELPGGAPPERATAAITRHTVDRATLVGTVTH